MSKKFEQIYNQSLTNPEEFWREISEDMYHFHDLWWKYSLIGPNRDQISFDAARQITKKQLKKFKDDYDAFVIACYGDPGVSACREITEKPVVGIGEASMHMACFLGHKFSIVTVIPRIKPLLEDLVTHLGLAAKCASIRATNLSVLEIEQDPERAVAEMINEAKLAVENDGAEAICLGCAGMGPLDLRVQEAIGVPVFDGTVSAIKVAESLVSYGKKTSKIGAYAWPEKKELVGCSPIIQSISE